EEKNSSLILKQERFNEKTNQVWQIPIIIQTANKEIRTLLRKKSQIISLPKNTNLIKLNREFKGFYRTEYNNEHLNNIKSYISQKKITVLDRTEIQNDLFNLTLINKIPISEYLDFIKAYENERSLSVLQDIYENLFSIYRIFSQEPYWNKIWPKFKDIMKKPFQNALIELGWNPKKNESQEDAILRPLSISYLSFSEDIETISKGLALFKNPESLHPDIKGSIYALAAKNNGATTFKTLLKHYEKTESPEEKVKILSALYKFKDEKILKSSLDFALSENVRIQDLGTVFSSLSSNPEIRQIFLPWTKENWRKLEKYKNTHFVFIGLLKSLITSYVGREKEEEIREFLNSKETGYEKTKANAFELMQINTNWLNNNKTILENYFS
ncbi:MAG: ERAP1-like C-terminal domain-containing protein, partial [Nanoarchaeota archaeon]